MHTQVEQNGARSPLLDRDAMILDYYPLVQNVAYRLVGRFPRNVDVNDLIAVGTLGLIDAIDRYSPEKHDSFRAYAELRIRGAIIDDIRQLDWAPRSVRQRLHQVEKAQRDLETEFGRPPTYTEVADRLGIDLEDYQKLQRKAASLSVLSLEDLGVRDENRRNILEVLEGESEDPAFVLETKRATERLASAIKTLPEKQRVVVTLYYFNDLTLKEIGEVLHVTESRVSQIHSAAITRLKAKLRNFELN